MNKTFFLLVPFFVFCFASCTVNKAKINNDLKKYFDSAHVEGSFSLLDNRTGSITVYNMNLDTQRISPGSTFKIMTSLIGIQAGKITDENMVIKEDSLSNTKSEENKSLTMKEAFQISSASYFQEIARQIGRETMKLWIDSIQYGNKDIDGPIDSFWLNNHLKISPDEQLGLMSKLYFDQLPFQKFAQQMVRNVMLMDDNTLYKLSYKTGLGIDENNNSTGWVVGWIEENRHVYFFVTLAKSPDKNIDMKTAEMNITKGILKELGFFKGEM
ncbi:MAG: penicillin-binding transpeptidase domain-containing protein [Bacteroidota bacterium]|nr:penicillin-binding transpeptidase domain-containing protein [Bacteroidota bacterium]